MSYYKGLDDALCARNGFRYEVGKSYAAETDDPWRWLHFAKKVTTAISYGTRIVAVEPLTRVCRYGSCSDMNAEKIRIVRELSRDEVIDKLVQEKCPVYRMVYYKPNYEELLRIRDHIKRCDHYSICYEFDWLTAEQKLSLLPKSWKNRVQYHEFDNRIHEELVRKGAL